MNASGNKRPAMIADRVIRLLLVACCFSLSCSVPNLEPQSCIEARTPIREFYSFHFGNEMNFSQENLKKREHFLTPEYSSRLSGGPDGADPFTTGDTDLPKAFRVGECKEISAGTTNFQVLLFWKDDVRSEQRAINVEATKQGDKWLVNNVSAVPTQ
jgi:hypothetical protein